MKAFDKYLLCCLLTLCFVGHGRAQNKRLNRNRQEIENINSDTLMTLTHTVPLVKAPSYLSQNPTIKFSNANEALYVELESFTNAIPENIKCVFSPLCIIDFFGRYKDVFDVGVHTTQMVENYTSSKMSGMTHDMYAYMKLRASGGVYSLRAGNLSVLNYAGQYFANYMPRSEFFTNALHMHSGHYYLRAIVAEFTNDEMAFHVGYAEEDPPGFKFTGNGNVVISTEVIVEDIFKGGLLLTIGRDKTVGDFQIVWTPKPNISLLLECVNIGKQMGLHGTYRHGFANGNMDFFLNGFKQFDDGVVGGNLGLRHAKSGAYVAIGATKHDPLYKTTADGLPNEGFNKFLPFAEFGIIYAIKR